MAGELGMKYAFLKLSRAFRGPIIAGTVMVCAFTVTGFLGRLWWMFDLTANFRVQYLGCLCLAAVLFLAGKNWLWAVVCGLFAIVNFLEILPSFTGRGKQGAASAGSIRVLLANVLSSNKEYVKFRELVRSVDADIIVLVEATGRWMKELSSLGEKYPHVVSRPRDDNFGIAVFSRQPFQECEILEIGDAGVPTAVARMRVDGQEVTLVATHPLPPMRGARFRYRNRQLERVAEYIQSIKEPVVLVGDLNTTPWSPHFKRLLRQAGLRDSRRGRGIQATWPAQLPPLRVPLDHVLYSSGFTVLRREVGPEIGSDHLPVIVDLSLTKGGNGR